jgi:hypothetical protein
MDAQRAALQNHNRNCNQNIKMKSQPPAKTNQPAAAVLDQKNPQFRSGTKSFTHRYERRKIREQLRHLDWALAGVD